MTITDLGVLMTNTGIRICSSFYSKDELIQRLKNNSFPQNNINSIDSQIQKANMPVMKGCINAQKFHKKYSEEQVKRINTNRKLPNGYLLGYTPQKITHHYLNGCYNGVTVIPPTYNLIKADKASALKNRYLRFIKKLPEGFQVMNTDDGSYITGKDVSKEELNKYLSSTLGKITTAIRKFFHN